MVECEIGDEDGIGHIVVVNGYDLVTGLSKASVDEAPHTPEIVGTDDNAQKPQKEVTESEVWEEIKDDPRLIEVYDQLIDLFKSKSRDKWKKLIVISRNWMMLACGVFER